MGNFDMETPQRSIRWMPCYNPDAEPIPPYSIVPIMCRSSDGVWVVSRGAGYWASHFDTTNDYDGVSGGPYWTALWAATGAQPIPAEGYGDCSQDWPLPVRFLSKPNHHPWYAKPVSPHLGLTEATSADMACSGRYFLDDDGRGRPALFAVIAKDEGLSNDGLSIYWIRPASPFLYQARAALAEWGEGICGQEEVLFYTASGYAAPGAVIATVDPLWRNVVMPHTKTRARSPLPGTFCIAFSACVTTTDQPSGSMTLPNKPGVPGGTPLVIKSSIHGGGLTHSQRMDYLAERPILPPAPDEKPYTLGGVRYLARYHNPERDRYGSVNESYRDLWVTGEMMSITFFARMSGSQYIEFRNESNCTLAISAAQASAYEVPALFTG